MATNDAQILSSEEASKLLLSAQETAKKYEDQLDVLRKDGTDKIEKTKNFIYTIKHNNMLKKSEKEAILNQQNTILASAKEIANTNKAQISSIDKEASAKIKEEFKQAYEARKAIYKQIVSENNAKKVELLEEEKDKHESALMKLQNELDSLTAEQKADKDLVDEKKKIIKSEKIAYKNACEEIKQNCLQANQKVKDEVHAIYMDKVSHLSNIHGNKNTIPEQIETKLENYVYNFNTKDFFLKNGLYIIIVIFMIVCIAFNPDLIQGGAIMNILKNFSTKIFFALGVAGLILLAGTDLSLGRLITLGSLITCMMLNPDSSTKVFNLSLSNIYDKIGFVPTAILALLFTILATTLFSAVSGFFTAKFKIHPFVTTMGTALVVWGLCGYSTNNVKTGSVSDSASKLVMTFGKNGFPITLIYAIIAILIVWFIWNKTTFGKNMYAVGDNAEAAAVSGISVFKTTILVFVMAGILYGFGSFFQGLVTGSSSSSLGQGWEMEAIAACVIGGISFSGGIGKISGAVMGCLLFEILKYYLRDMTNGNSDIANIFIGAIIVLAVTFDSIKYLKKK